MIGDPFIIKRNDTRPTYVNQLRENIGTEEEGPVDFTGASGIMIVVRESGADPDDQPPKFKKAAAFLVPANGEVEYEWEEGDTDTAGSFEIEFEITWAPGETETIPNDDYFGLTVKADLG